MLTDLIFGTLPNMGISRTHEGVIQISGNQTLKALYFMKIRFGRHLVTDYRLGPN